MSKEDYKLLFDVLNNQYSLKRQSDGKTLTIPPDGSAYKVTLLTIEYINRLRETGNWTYASEVFDLWSKHVFEASGVDDD